MAKKGPERKESPSSGGRAHPSENRIQKLKTAAIGEQRRAQASGELES